MMLDIKEMIGILMRVTDAAEPTQNEVADLDFEAVAEGELSAALNEAYIKLLEFVHDRNQRRVDTDLDRTERTALQQCLEKIVRLCTR